ncbi:MAG: hypothetical protein UY31_C0073G0015 [Candidatus Wolfebacteria bacterium GW2011_GWE1_48_7]|uniref:Uncharacterized protein n=2 Tax=Candidatus Wolfeibacteriota TaxID=1752735 RepID=A0A0G1U5U6_9BACT|nr:MAG: hypothetical protein UX70_C0001G0583 [Candidatus Wolfebacteria bacterium GW2011_GWB1_47_1]KKU34831.1 MAG: hypothetical protein UX49_C0034G0014 [Candidatus Wolfebacteria bacterium GW2011_GWC2_46_275]KKU42486.1 MAG: hypothetical protein UX58_C0002G0200 [Candidatus Wolfebacteria bacterium GW2011_GWB2_46_69]KKU54271.1 MAG: hypothetical protein UX76_C0004G0075 [Candidatus Wolfebacteria bacterium GW2011_GWC1_47_103]KKU59639.1 MAG: hypothetical protein UX83_C0003G0054 [Candidatus Wolfebacteria
MLHPIWREINPQDKKLYGETRALVELIPDDIGLGSDYNGKRVELSCHIVARAFANVFSDHVRCVDGYFSAGFPHSWLETEDFALIDTFPVQMIGGPLLFWKHPLFHMKVTYALYQEEPSVMHGVYKNVGKWQFDRAVGILTDLLIALH